MEPNILKLAAGTTNQVSSGAKHPVTWKRDIFFWCAPSTLNSKQIVSNPHLIIVMASQDTDTLCCPPFVMLQIYYSMYFQRIPALPTLSSCPRCVVWGTCNVDITCNLLIRSQLHLFALSEHPRQSSSTTNSAELQKAWQWRQPQVASSQLAALWWMIKLNWYPPWK